MKKSKSLFVRVIKDITNKLLTEVASCEKITDEIGINASKKSTLYLGHSLKYDKHVFIDFQKTPKSLECDRFTVNISVSNKYNLNDVDYGFDLEGDKLIEGIYRLGHMEGIQDFWWSLSYTDEQDDNYIKIFQPEFDVEDEIKVINWAVESVFKKIDDIILSKNYF